MEAAVRKMSSLAAETFRLTEYRGIEAGCRANVVAFDPERVIDLATFENSKQYPEGIQHVIVEGRHVVRNGEQLDAGPGIAFRSGGR
jgi:N-acyl-D-aspartate/D-glutamate deacylase